MTDMTSSDHTSTTPFIIDEAFFAQRLSNLTPVYLHLEDESAAHHGHAGASGGAGHYRLCIVSQVFDTMTRLQRHRAVYQHFTDLMPHRIHALSIDAFSPSEYDGLFGVHRQ
jgi:BolA protein